VIVTIFTSGAQQTLPIWIFANLSRPAELPIINVVALFVIVVSLVPVWLAQRLTQERATVIPAPALEGASNVPEKEEAP
jgi:putative spermidine/putrescine transport system permease protein